MLKRKSKRFTVKKRTINLQKLLPVLLLIGLVLSVIVVSQRTSWFQEAAKKVTKKANKPNIILIVTDDQRADTLRYMPNVKRLLVDRGMTFTNAYATTPLCCPNRVNILTGRYPHNHKIWHNMLPFGGALKFQSNGGDHLTLATLMNRNGYKTSYVGKYLNNYKEKPKYIPPGWDDWHVYAGGELYYDFRLNDNGKLNNYPRKVENYTTTVFRKYAVNFIKDTKKPFFLLFAPQAPHATRGEKPPSDPRDRERCNHVPGIEFPPSFNEVDQSDKPNWIKNRQKLSKAKIEEVREFRRGQICSLYAVDEAVGAMVRALGNRLNNTVIIFTSDNGYMWGEHRIVAKNVIYEESIKVPLVIRAPGVPNGKITNALVASIDLAPTIANLAGLPVTQYHDGVSMKPLLLNPQATLRDTLLIEYYNNNTKHYEAAVRTLSHKYAETYNSNTKSFDSELYDMVNDPYELNNIASDASQQDLMNDLKQKMKALQKNDPNAESPVNTTVINETEDEDALNEFN